MTRLLTIVLASMLATAVHAQSLVTVTPGPETTAWWLRADFHALDREVRGIPVAKIRADWCKASEFTRERFPKELLVENGTDLLAESKLSFSLEGHFDGSATRQVALVGTYETCRGRKGRFVLIIDADTRKIRYVEAGPAKDRFSGLFAEGPTAIRIVYCLECDSSSVVRWDRAKKRFVAQPGD